MMVYTLPCGVLQANMYLVVGENRHAVLIDPIDATLLHHILDEHSLTLEAVLLTHGHFDHAADLPSIVADQMLSIPTYIHAADAELLQDPCKNASLLIMQPVNLGTCSHFLHGGETLIFDDITISVFATPGHTEGSLSYQIGDMLFTGDTLFSGSCGRTDLYGGNSRKLSESLHKLMLCDSSLKVFPGHGPSTTLQHEALYNPYFRNDY